MKTILKYDNIYDKQLRALKDQFEILTGKIENYERSEK